MNNRKLLFALVELLLGMLSKKSLPENNDWTPKINDLSYSRRH